MFRGISEEAKDTGGVGRELIGRPSPAEIVGPDHGTIMQS